MKKILFILALALSFNVDAQYQYDYGIKIGAANYLGDVGGFDQPRRDFVVDMHLGQTRYAVGGYGRYKFSKRFAVAINLDYMMIQDADENSTWGPRRARNLNFRNRMFELGARLELTLWYDNDVGNRGYYNPDYKLYAFGGVAGFYHNPQARLVYDVLDSNYYQSASIETSGMTNGQYVDNNWYDLKPLQTEGVRYSNIGLAIPVGLGMYFTFNKSWRIGWEISWRTAFTDYLDDVSTEYYQPTPQNPEDYQLALALQSQTYDELLAEVDAAGPYTNSEGVEIENINRAQQSYTGVASPALRGLKSNNDSYITTQVTVGKVVRGRSKFYKSKYSWVKTRNVKRSRAKF